MFILLSGTAHFMPPEWVTDGEYMGIPATVWGLGVLLYYLVTGEYPFETKKDLDHGCLELGPDISRGETSRIIKLAVKLTYLNEFYIL